MISNFKDITHQLWMEGSKEAQTVIDKLEYLKDIFQNNYSNGYNPFFFCNKNILNSNLVFGSKDPKDIFKDSNRMLYDDFNSYYKFNTVLKDLLDNTKLHAYIDYPELKNSVTRLFATYVSPELKRRYSENPKMKIPVHIFFHPSGNGYIAENQKDYYHQDGFVHNDFRDLARRYLFEDHKLVFQHRYAIKHDKHLKEPFNIPSLLIFPVFCQSAYNSFPTHERAKVKKKIGFFSIIKELVKHLFQSKSSDKIGYMALSGYSEGNKMIKRSILLARNDYLTKKVDTGTELIKALFFFDPADNFGLDPKLLDEWLNIEPKQRKSYKLYAAKRGKFRSEINSQIKNKHLLHDYVEADLKSFNDKDKLPIDLESIFPEDDYITKLIKKTTKYQRLINPFEFYSEDMRRYYFIFPSQSFQVHLRNTINVGGINLGFGHAFFHRHFVTHALAHSDFP